jgi:hypothetical protein
MHPIPFHYSFSSFCFLVLLLYLQPVSRSSRWRPGDPKKGPFVSSTSEILPPLRQAEVYPFLPLAPLLSFLATFPIGPVKVLPCPTGSAISTLYSRGLFILLIMEAERISETSVYFNETERRYIFHAVFPLASRFWCIFFVGKTVYLRGGVVEEPCHHEDQRGAGCRCKKLLKQKRDKEAAGYGQSWRRCVMCTFMFCNSELRCTAPSLEHVKWTKQVLRSIYCTRCWFTTLCKVDVKAGHLIILQHDSLCIVKM